MNLHGLLFSLFVFAVNAEWSTLDELMWSVRRIGFPHRDTPETLNELISENKALLTNAAPIGALIAEGLEHEFEPDSEEQSDLRKLNTRMIETFKDFGWEKLEPFSTRSSNDLQDLFENIVDKGINKLVYLFGKVTDPIVNNRRMYKDDFVKACSSQMGSPDAMLSFTEVFYHEKCPIPTEETVQKNLRFLRALRTMDPETDKSTAFSWLKSRRTLLRHYARMTDKESITSLLETKSSDEIIGFLRDAEYPGAKREEQQQCLLQSVLDQYTYDKTEIRSAVDKMRYAIVKAEILAMACWNVTTEGGPSDLEELINTTSTRVEAMLGHVHDFVKESQKLSFPLVAIEESISALTESEGLSLNEQADVVKQTFWPQGGEGNMFQVLITENIGTDEIRILPVNNSTQIHFLGPHGLAIHVFIHNTRSYSFELTMWIDKKSGEIRRALEAERDNVNLTSALENVHNKINKPGKHRYSAAVLLRKEGYLASAIDMRIGLSHRSQVDYLHNGSSTAHLTRLLLFP